jgi:hypothetical protein
MLDSLCLVVLSLCHYMDTLNKTSTDRLASLLLKFVEAGMEGNRQRLELLTLGAIRSLRTDYPAMTGELGSIISKFTSNGGTVRGQVSEPPPSDADAGLSLLRIVSLDNSPEPIFAPVVREQCDRFLVERAQCDCLLRQGFSPPRTLLVKGAPGTGKTMLAKWIAYKLGLRFVVLDLATSMSSYLGKTGSNLRRSLDYARATPCVFLIDEFDAIAKRRDDATEIGELKRIVNVLLKELEDWPMHSVLIAATNHPELLDPAIHRRFDVVLNIPLPSAFEREAIIARTCGQFLSSLPDGFLKTAAGILEGRNGSDLETMTQAAARNHVISQTPFVRCFIESMCNDSSLPIPKKHLASLVGALQKNTQLTVREIASLLGKGASTVQYHLTKENAHGRVTKTPNTR